MAKIMKPDRPQPRVADDALARAGQVARLCIFVSTGGAQSFTVPAGVTSTNLTSKTVPASKEGDLGAGGTPATRPDSRATVILRP